MTNVEKEMILQKTEKHVKGLFLADISGHDYFHMIRVLKIAKYIATKEKPHDLFIVQLGALLHDIADWKFHNGDITAGKKAAKVWLEGLSVPKDIVEKVCYIVEHISYRGGTNKVKMESIEGMIVQDADRLDALGAIGIARVFSYGGYKGRAIYDPEIKPKKAFSSLKEYADARNTSINHFYEKLLLLKDKMNTKTGRDIAKKRHAFTEEFLERFLTEWEGNK